MLLSRIFEHLTYVTVPQLSISGAASGAVNPDDYPKLITVTNAGLVDLYTRFQLRTRELPLQLQEGKTIYKLHSDYAESNTASTETVKYIVDGTVIHPFIDNIIVIDQVFDEIGNELPLNDAALANSVFTPSQIELQVPQANSANMLAVLYRALPDIIPTSTTNLATIEVDLPVHFLDALTNYMAWKLLVALDRVDAQPGAQSHANYLESINIIELKSVVVVDNYSNQRFGENGWH